MHIIAFCMGAILALVALWDMFESVILPRTVSRKFRLSRIFYRSTWRAWRALAERMPWRDARTNLLGAFGPLSLPLLLGLWALLLILGFALVQWGLGTPLWNPGSKSAAHLGWAGDFYWSGATFFTLGYGDIVPRTNLARAISIGEAGVGFAFLAIVIGYLPVLYQSFSRREVGISLLDSRAGSPPCAGELLRRYGEGEQMAELAALLAEFERWAADLLESHLSYPVLAFYRSQHDRQSWLAALNTVLDTCALVSLGFQNHPPWEKSLIWQAQHTFAMARHAAIDLALVLGTPPVPPQCDRLPPEELHRLRSALTHAGVYLNRGESADAALLELRRQYEPFLSSLGDRLLLTLPPWAATGDIKDNWQTSAWEDGVHF